jgi:hypothetical protein
MDLLCCLTQYKEPGIGKFLCLHRSQYFFVLILILNLVFTERDVHGLPFCVSLRIPGAATTMRDGYWFDSVR